MKTQTEINEDRKDSSKRGKYTERLRHSRRKTYNQLKVCLDWHTNRRKKDSDFANKRNKEKDCVCV